jgi:spore germination protein YaaH
MDSAGRIHSRIDSNLLKFARRYGIPIMPLIVNERFSVDVAKSLFSDPRMREGAADSILKFVLDNDFIGINLDFEGPFTDVRDGYTKFVELVCAKLHNYGKIVSVDVVSKTAEKFTGWAGVYDYKELGEVVDYFIIMGYDYSGRLDPPGPIAPRWWVEETIRFALSQGIPSEKIVLGIPFYGRLWRKGENGRGIYHFELKNIIDKYRPRLRWDMRAESPYLEFRDEDGIRNIIYFENDVSLARKLDLVNRYDLAGIAIWRLDGEPEIYWKVIREKLGLEIYLSAD